MLKTHIELASYYDKRYITDIYPLDPARLGAMGSLRLDAYLGNPQILAMRLSGDGSITAAEKCGSSSH
jgi:hypothetical protein